MNLCLTVHDLSIAKRIYLTPQSLRHHLQAVSDERSLYLFVTSKYPQAFVLTLYYQEKLDTPLISAIVSPEFDAGLACRETRPVA
jgi:hypothetical protein